jgi:hypothetical protein
MATPVFSSLPAKIRREMLFHAREMLVQGRQRLTVTYVTENMMALFLEDGEATTEVAYPHVDLVAQRIAVDGIVIAEAVRFPDGTILAYGASDAFAFKQGMVEQRDRAQKYREEF